MKVRGFQASIVNAIDDAGRNRQGCPGHARHGVAPSANPRLLGPFAARRRLERPLHARPGIISSEYASSSALSMLLLPPALAKVSQSQTLTRAGAAAGAGRARCARTLQRGPRPVGGGGARVPARLAPRRRLGPPRRLRIRRRPPPVCAETRRPAAAGPGAANFA